MAVRKTLRKPQFWFGLSVLGPTLIWYGIFGLWPVLSAFWISVVNYKIMDPLSSPFVGLDNFKQTFNNFLFPIAVKNTLEWAVLQFVIMLPVSLADRVHSGQCHPGPQHLPGVDLSARGHPTGCRIIALPHVA